MIESRPSEDEVYQSALRLLEPIGVHDFESKEVCAIENHDHRVVAECSPVVDDPVLRDIRANEAARGWPTNEFWEKLESLRWVAHGQEIDISKIVPRGVSIYFPAKSEYPGAAVYVPADQSIYLSGSILSPAELIVLLHEIGHAVDLENNHKNRPHLQAEEFAFERSANAFAFNVLRPSFRTDEQWKTDVVNWLKHASLHDYAQKMFPKNPGMHRGDWDEYEDWDGER